MRQIDNQLKKSYKKREIPNVVDDRNMEKSRAGDVATRKRERENERETERERERERESNVTILNPFLPPDSALPMSPCTASLSPVAASSSVCTSATRLAQTSLPVDRLQNKFPLLL